MNKMFFSVLLMASTFIVKAQQTVNYNDVAVIVNDNSQVSVDIGNYFQAQRAIPDQNMIHISASTSEEIDSLEFAQIRQQIENYLITNNLSDSINYLVTTKGVPLKIANGNCDSLSLGHCTSVDSELSLILGNLSNEIMSVIPSSNPYHEENVHFSRADYGIYLVTRLDGYSKQDVLNLIDRSGPGTAVNQSIVNSVFDISHVVNAAELNLYDQIMQSAIGTLSNNGWATTYHPDSLFLTNQERVFCYYSINFQPENKQLNNTWVRGSIAEMMLPFSANTFDMASNSDNAVLLADLISEGATGGHGSAYATFVSITLDGNILFDRYTDTAFNYNLAESYYMALPRLSWQSVVIGDPKSSIVIDNTLSVESFDLTHDIEIYPNPSNGQLFISTGGFEVISLKAFNQIGQLVLSQTQNFYGNEITVDISSNPNGVYFLHIETEKGLFNEKVIVAK